jgi:hypothetical protein
MHYQVHTNSDACMKNTDFYQRVYPVNLILLEDSIVLERLMHKYNAISLSQEDLGLHIDLLMPNIT